MKFYVKYNIENEPEGTILAIPKWHFNKEWNRDEKDPEKLWNRFYGGFLHGNISIKRGRIIDKELWVYDGISSLYLLAKGKEIILNKDCIKKLKQSLPSEQTT